MPQTHSRIVFIPLRPFWIVLHTILKSDNKQLFAVILISIVVISSILPLSSYDLAAAKSKKRASENSDTSGTSSKDVTNQDNVSSQQPNSDNGIPQQSPTSNLGEQQSSLQNPTTELNATSPQQPSSSENTGSGKSPTFVPQPPRLI